MADARFYAQPFPTYQKAMRCILSISQGYPALVTTTYDGVVPGAHQYQDGLIIRFHMENGWGMELLNRQKAAITVINATQFTVPIDTTNFDAYSIPPINPGHYATPPTVVPIGEVNEILTQATQNVLPYT